MQKAAECSLCGGTGTQIVRNAQGERVPQPCSCRAARLVMRRLERAGIPRRHEHATLENYESVETKGAHETMLHAHFKATKFVADYPQETDGRGLMFIGKAGRGKTHLAVGVLRALIEEKGCQGLFCDYADLLKQIQNSYNPRSETTEYQLLKPVMEVEVLVLDDLGSTKPTAWVLDTVAQILNARYNGKLTTILTTNYANLPPVAVAYAGRSATAAAAREDTLGDRIGERMRSRLVEMCLCLEILGEDFRQTAGAARFAWSEAEWIPDSDR